MIIFLYGSDTYRLKEKLEEIIGQYDKAFKGGLNLRSPDLGKSNFDSFFDNIQQVSMFGGKNITVLKESLKNTAFKTEFPNRKKDFLESENIIIFYEEGELPKEDVFLKFLKKHTKIQELKPLEGDKLKNWVLKEFLRYNAKIEVKVAEKIIEFIGNDLWQLSNEIKKLASFKKSQKIDIIDVNLLVKPKIEVEIFRTIDAIAARNKKQALYLIHKHLEKGESPLYLLSMINFQFRNILAVKDFIEKNKPYRIILKQSKLHPFVVKKSYFQAQRFTIQELKKIYQKIFQVDLGIKTGRIEPEVGLSLLVGEI